MKMRKNSKNYQNSAGDKSPGFSLIEAMIVLMILAIAAAIAVPLMVGSFGRANSEVYMDRVRAALELGRITAMSESISVFLCPTANGSSCNTTVTAANWGNNRLLLFTSSAGNSTEVDRIISIVEAPEAGDYISSSNGINVRFRPNGLSATALTLRYCSVVDDQGVNRFIRTIVINIIGRITSNVEGGSQSC